MSSKALLLILVVLAALILAPAPATADGKTKMAQEVAEFALRKFGKEAAKDGAQALARRLERAALAHGDEVFRAVRKVGPRGLHLIEQAGAHSPQVARVLARHGEHGLVYVVRQPKALQLVLRHGEQAANVLVKSRGLALPAVESLGKPALRAFGALGTAQNTRRLAMMAAEGGGLAKIGRTAELLAVIEKGGDAAMSFIWRHKGALAVTATLAAFLQDPQSFITGAKDLTQIATENVVKPVVQPLAEVPNTIAKESAAEVARHTNWTLVFISGIAALTLLVTAFGRRLTRLLPATTPAVPPRPAKPSVPPSLP